MTKIKKEAEGLTNFLRNVFTKDEKFFIYTNPMRVKRKYCIAEFTDVEGGKIGRSNFITYAEMNCFFMGMLAIKDNPIKFLN